jgi:hypothetical protein
MEDTDRAHTSTAAISVTRMRVFSSAPRRRREEEKEAEAEDDDLDLSFGEPQQNAALVHARHEAALAADARIAEDRRLARTFRRNFVDYCYWRLLVPSDKLDDADAGYVFSRELFGSSTQIFEVKDRTGAVVRQPGGTKNKVWCLTDDGRRLGVDDVPSEFPRRVNVGGTGTSLDRIWMRAIRRAWLAHGNDVPISKPQPSRYFTDSHRQGLMTSALSRMRNAMLAQRDRLTVFAFDVPSILTAYEEDGPAIREFIARLCSFFRLETQEHEEYHTVFPGQAEQPESYTVTGGHPGDADLIVASPGCTFRVWINQIPTQPNKTGPPPTTEQVLEFFSVHLNLMLMDFVGSSS